MREAGSAASSRERNGANHDSVMNSRSGPWLHAASNAAIVALGESPSSSSWSAIAFLTVVQSALKQTGLSAFSPPTESQPPSPANADQVALAWRCPTVFAWATPCHQPVANRRAA